VGSGGHLRAAINLIVGDEPMFQPPLRPYPYPWKRNYVLSTIKTKGGFFLIFRDGLKNMIIRSYSGHIYSNIFQSDEETNIHFY